MRRLAATTVLIALLAAAASAGPAQARWTSNVCPNAGFSRFTASDLQPGEERFCNPRWNFDSGEPGFNWTGDPYWKHGWHLLDQNPPPWDAASGCGLNWSIKGSESQGPEQPRLPPAADWDYWVGSVFSGVSFLPPWGDSATWAVRGTDATQKNLLGMYAIYPEYTNWAPWGSSVQTLATCVPATSRAVTARASAATPRDDNLTTGDGRDRLDGGPGDDRISTGAQRDLVDGGVGDDRIDAGAGHDDLHGGEGRDSLNGGAGNDTLVPGPHDDVARGGSGQDRLFDNQGADELHGGAHTDFLSARDGDRDIVDCGSGEDVAVGDREDSFRGCEHVYKDPRRDPARPPRL